MLVDICVPEIDEDLNNSKDSLLTTLTRSEGRRREIEEETADRNASVPMARDLRSSTVVLPPNATKRYIVAGHFLDDAKVIGALLAP